MDNLKFYLNKQIDIYKKVLITKVQQHNFNLQHSEVIALSQTLDILILRYWNLDPKVKKRMEVFNVQDSSATQLPC
ncbi:Spo0E family sporulation regulatory protein-aspartic acid phosphatase [Paenibacillus sp. LMG 31456]|uniref:Spo0E family sporulation regulatory protein-aspartic acid phosphatase n=1 Tax=Paenibacillus foliorum TaxID=2654974 RepID=A0A972GSQ5_9BACL|nr:aspartyl-phosphate phosphatase Spo0E family protein [Paenibacillus foliorum]NOU95638.1 Spo0E family sporulation regulatory protein-aspartic acid phosphatase [Paenibacillus foliorum]